jgi:hypothetical protein
MSVPDIPPTIHDFKIFAHGPSLDLKRFGFTTPWMKTPCKLFALYGVKYIDANRIDLGILLADSGFYDQKLSRHRSRLASNDEGDARPDKVRSRWY